MEIFMEHRGADSDTVPQALADYLARLPKAALAFSGGVDSCYLLYAARACGVDIHAYYVNSQFQPRFELEDARRAAREAGAGLTVIDMDILAHDAVGANPPDRCYHCKRTIFGAVLSQAATDGYPVLMDGSNASDDAADRPGMRALRELKVCSPLREAGLTKEQIRNCSRKAGLFTWNKPAYACLATRVPTGHILTPSLLKAVEQAEQALADMGFTDFRVRVSGTAAKLQLTEEQFGQAVRLRGEIVQVLTEWFSDVLLDMKPR